jgi:DNA-directed RNA polymerase specialized sigma24 family protein
MPTSAVQLPPTGRSAGSPIRWSKLELHEALLRLAERDARAARVVQLTYFGGMRAHEIAPVLEVSDATIERDLAFGRSWLERDLST